jgi:nitrogen-specific signal transduction histidine kinase
MSGIYAALKLAEMEMQEKPNGKPSLNIVDQGKGVAEQESELKHPEAYSESRVSPSGVKAKIPAGDQTPRPWPSFLVEFANHIKDTLGSIKGLTELSQGRFKDQEYGDNFCKMVIGDIDKADSELACFLDYVKIKSPAQKANTVHIVLDALLRDHEKRLKDRKIKVAKKQYEKDLPETSVQDEQLKYILKGILHLAVLSVPPGGNIGIVTRVVDTQETGEDLKTWVQRKSKYIEIIIAFNDSEKAAEQVRAGQGVQTAARENGRDFILPLIEDIVQENGGMIRSKVDDEKHVTQISLLLPVERRKVTYYPCS